MDIGNMNFDKRNGNAGQCIAQGDTGMGKGGRINQDKGRAIRACGMDAVDQLMLSVALELFQGKACGAGVLAQLLLNIGEGCVAVYMRFTTAQQIQIWPLQYQNACHDDSPEMKK